MIKRKIFIFFSFFLFFISINSYCGNILYFVDYSVGTDYMMDALNNLSTVHNVVVADNISDFDSKLANGNWDLAILMLQNDSFEPTDVPNYVNYIQNNGKTIFTDWSENQGFADLFQISYTGNDNLDNVTILHQSLKNGISNPLLLNNPGWGTYSMGMSTQNGTVAGIFSNGDAAIIIALNGNAIINGFLTDTPANSSDGIKFFENEIKFLLAQKPKTVPTLSEWGIIITIFFLGFIAFGFIRKQV